MYESYNIGPKTTHGNCKNWGSAMLVVASTPKMQSILQVINNTSSAHLCPHWSLIGTSLGWLPALEGLKLPHIYIQPRARWPLLLVKTHPFTLFFEPSHLTSFHITHKAFTFLHSHTKVVVEYAWHATHCTQTHGCDAQCVSRACA